MKRKYAFWAYSVLINITLLLVVSCSASPSKAGSPTPALPSPSLSPAASVTPTFTPSPVPATASPTPLLINVCSPLASHNADDITSIISQFFIAPSKGKDDGHPGLDFGSYLDGKLNIGVVVQAALTGKVAALINNRPPYGYAVLIETPFQTIPIKFREQNNIPADNSLYILYAHLQNLPDLQLTQQVDCGQPIGITGLSGFTGGPHLHLETRSGPANITFDSMAYYRADASPQELINYTTWRLSETFQLINPLPLFKP